MYISLAESRANGFRKWSDAHPPHRNDGASGDVIADLGSDYAAMTPAEQAHGPWRVPGVGNAL